jgi:hypothetical protein
VASTGGIGVDMMRNPCTVPEKITNKMRKRKVPNAEESAECCNMYSIPND